MSGVRLLTSARVGQLLRVSDETLRRWNLHGVLPAETRLTHNIRHYKIEALDAFLRDRASGFSAVPTTLDMLAGRLTLLTAQEAMEALGGISEPVLFDRVEMGRIATIKLHGLRRYSLQSIKQYLSGSSASRRDLIPREKVTHILGVSVKTLNDLVRDGRLTCEEVTEDQHLRPVTASSLVALLRPLLPDWMSPEDWIEDRLISDKPLVRARVVMRIIEEDSNGLERLIAKRQLHCIYSPSGTLRMFSPESIALYLESQPVLTSTDFARQFGVGRTTVSLWHSRRLIVCPALGHVHGEGWDFTRVCLISILRECLSPRLPVHSWYNWRLQNDSPLLTVRDMANALGLKYGAVIALVEAGEINGIQAPSGMWQFSVRQLERVRPRLKKQ